MKTNGNDKALEAYKIFPYIAWTLIIGFTFFVYTIVQDLKAVASELELKTAALETKTSTSNHELTDFDSR